MGKHIENTTMEKKKEIEKRMSKTFNPGQEQEGNVLSIILSKISDLEKKVDRIESQTKTHWTN